ncbi:site-2 protease family protein [Clostridium sp. YIM B02505]|uniref:Site-2 protease family protein n=1 Tax=Clostridium yunnanense TaxID=2800325 RepID=A0ABS1EWI1_9CLOT|nr:site-2 protease family protein [Clostridium yunnanense]MBK1813674.1 site-2 protease family protein [Clostridium yunnanense]
MREKLLELILIIPAILIGFTFHEYAHAKVADMLGDKTPRFQGRLTLNPLAHIDPIGLIMILIVKFGWAKPVQINRRAFKNGYKDDLKVTIAGPLANLLVAIIFSVIFGLAYKFYFINNYTDITNIIVQILNLIIIINVNLFVFNLLPLPGLDGFGILEDLFPSTFSRIADSLYRYQFIIFALIAFGGVRFLEKPTGFILDICAKIVTGIIA